MAEGIQRLIRSGRIVTHGRLANLHVALSEV